MHHFDAVCADDAKSCLLSSQCSLADQLSYLLAIFASAAECRLEYQEGGMGLILYLNERRLSLRVFLFRSTWFRSNEDVDNVEKSRLSRPSHVERSKLNDAS